MPDRVYWNRDPVTRCRVSRLPPPQYWRGNRHCGRCCLPEPDSTAYTYATATSAAVVQNVPARRRCVLIANTRFSSRVAVDFPVFAATAVARPPCRPFRPKHRPEKPSTTATSVLSALVDDDGSSIRLIVLGFAVAGFAAVSYLVCDVLWEVAQGFVAHMLPFIYSDSTPLRKKYGEWAGKCGIASCPTLAFSASFKSLTNRALRRTPGFQTYFKQETATELRIKFRHN